MTAAVNWQDEAVLSIYRRMTADGRTADDIALAIRRSTDSSLATRNAVIGRWQRDRIKAGGPPPTRRRKRGLGKKREERTMSKKIRVELRAPEPRHLPIEFVPPPQPEAPPQAPVELLVIRDGCCRWPIGDSPPFLFCGSPVFVPADKSKSPSSYCEQHHDLAHVPTRKSADQRPTRWRY